MPRTSKAQLRESYEDITRLLPELQKVRTRTCFTKFWRPLSKAYVDLVNIELELQEYLEEEDE